MVAHLLGAATIRGAVRLRSACHGQDPKFLSDPRKPVDGGEVAWVTSIVRSGSLARVLMPLEAVTGKMRKLAGWRTPVALSSRSYRQREGNCCNGIWRTFRLRVGVLAATRGHFHLVATNVRCGSSACAVRFSRLDRSAQRRSRAMPRPQIWVDCSRPFRGRRISCCHGSPSPS